MRNANDGLIDLVRNCLANNFPSLALALLTHTPSHCFGYTLALFLSSQYTLSNPSNVLHCESRSLTTALCRRFYGHVLDELGRYVFKSQYRTMDIQLFSILGVAAFFGGFARLTVSMVAVLFEFTLTEVVGAGG